MQRAPLPFLLAFYIPTICQAATLAERFERLSCAVIQVLTYPETGTGVFIDKDGTILTASHVVHDKQWILTSAQQIQLMLTPRQNIRYRPFLGEPVSVLTPTITDEDRDMAAYDLALLHTGNPQKCFIPVKRNLSKLTVGEHLISIGAPASSPDGVLYEGFLSARYAHLGAIGLVEGHPDIPVLGNYEVLRIQMPITAGVSGGPVIADDDTVVGINSEIPVYFTRELARIIQVYLAHNPAPSGMILMQSFNTNQVLAELANVVREFESPGAGLAVPTSYLPAK
jgi:hypothetical protein